jgi:hypothetical protein
MSFRGPKAHHNRPHKAMVFPTSDKQGWKSEMKGAMVGFDASEDQLTAAAQVSADRWIGHGLWRAGIVRTAEYAVALPDGG